jgi:hypothetical protein
MCTYSEFLCRLTNIYHILVDYTHKSPSYSLELICSVELFSMGKINLYRLRIYMAMCPNWHAMGEIEYQDVLDQIQE